MNDILIKTENLTKVYGEKIKTKALDNVSLEVKKGEFIAIMGSSGHGKSTLLHLISGLDNPTSGKVFIDNIDIYKLKESELTELRCKKIGFVFQSFNLIPILTSRENIEMAMMLLGIPQGEQEEKAKRLLKLLDIESKENSKPSELSGGQRQRVAIARALANNPEILLMDEPTGNLDSKSAEDMMKHIKKLNEMGQTIVIITHDANIANYAHKIYRIHDGQIVF
jgi:putative ABC transport system ATP-binding protein